MKFINDLKKLKNSFDKKMMYRLMAKIFFEKKKKLIKFEEKKK